MRFDLKHPCENCPFANIDTRITFACRERAEEIEESAYRQGFPCHLHAECREDEYGEEEGFEFKDDGSSQHCMGALMMYLYEGGGNVPFEWLDEAEQDRIQERIDWDRYPVFEGAAAFLDANTEKDDE